MAFHWRVTMIPSDRDVAGDWPRRARGLQVLLALTLACVLGACAIAPPRPTGQDDPYQSFNRRMYAFNATADKYVLRPVAKAYVKVTGPKGREHIGDFFANLRAPVTIANELLQGRPLAALQSTARFLVNTTLGLLGFFDPATGMHLPSHPTDFGITLARWGVPEGPYLVLPFIGPTTVRDVWRIPVDSYFDPMDWYIRERKLKWHAEYAPNAMYLIVQRADVLPYDKVLDSAVDPYAFVRDAYRQQRLNEVYFGNPPLSAIEALQGTNAGAADQQTIEKLLEEQREYERTHGSGTTPAPGASAPPASSAGISAPATSAPAAATSTGTPARGTVAPVPAASVPAPASSTTLRAPVVPAPAASAATPAPATSGAGK